MLLLNACTSAKHHEKSKDIDVCEIGIEWIDNIEDAYYKIQNSPNDLSKDASLKYMQNCVKYYKETLEHATDEERKILEKYFIEKAEKMDVNPEVLLNNEGEYDEND